MAGVNGNFRELSGFVSSYLIIEEMDKETFFLLLRAMEGSWARELPAYSHKGKDLRNKGNQMVSVKTDSSPSHLLGMDLTILEKPVLSFQLRPSSLLASAFTS